METSNHNKIPFKVSARTAKLIGLENFSNEEGAIIELVKNTYDADAKNCIIIFDIKYSSILNDNGEKVDHFNNLDSRIFIIDNGIYHPNRLDGSQLFLFNSLLDKGFKSVLVIFSYLYET